MTIPIAPERPVEAAVPPAPPAAANPVQCALCGHRFVPNEATMSCAACPLHRRCAVLCCPHCGYEFVTESKVVALVRRLFRR